MDKKVFLTQKGPKAVGPYSTAVCYGDTVYVSGMIPVDPATGKFADDVSAQARQAFENVGTVLGEMGLGYGDVLKTTVFLTDLGDFKTVNEIYAKYFGPDYPARSCVQVAALPLGVKLEIEIIAGRR